MSIWLFELYFSVCLFLMYLEVREYLSWKGLPSRLSSLRPDYSGNIMLNLLFLAGIWGAFNLDLPLVLAAIAVLAQLLIIFMWKTWVTAIHFKPVHKDHAEGWFCSFGKWTEHIGPLDFRYPFWHRTVHWIPTTALIDTCKKRRFDIVVAAELSARGFSRQGELRVTINVVFTRPVQHCPPDYHNLVEKAEKEIRSLAQSLLAKQCDVQAIAMALNNYRCEGVVITFHELMFYCGESLLPRDLIAVQHTQT